jgi:hypothetical protein
MDIPLSPSIFSAHRDSSDSKVVAMLEPWRVVIKRSIYFICAVTRWQLRLSWEISMEVLYCSSWSCDNSLAVVRLREYLQNRIFSIALKNSALKYWSIGIYVSLLDWTYVKGTKIRCWLISQRLLSLVAWMTNWNIPSFLATFINSSSVTKTSKLIWREPS